MNSDFQLPAALKDYGAYRLWVVWRKFDQGNGKSTKVPYQPDNPGRKAKNNDPATWSNAATAISVAVEHAADWIAT